MEIQEYKNVKRNDPCPCHSGKKFKKCHGENTPWQGNTAPAQEASAEEAGDAAPQFDPSQMDLSWLAQFSSAIQRLPKGQMQQLQALMQKGMAGKDVTRELEELQRRLPPSFQELLKSSPELDKQLAAAQGGTSAEEQNPLTDEQRTQLQEIQKNNDKAGLSRLWSKFRKNK